MILQNSWIPSLVKLGYSSLDGVRFIPPTGTQCILACFKGQYFHKKLLDFERLAIQNPSPSTLLVASINDWLSLLALSKQDLENFSKAFDKLLFSLSLDC